jgi:hypothetical protein
LPEEAKVSEKKPPLWTCPKCGHQFVTRNMSQRWDAKKVLIEEGESDEDCSTGD